MRREIRRTILTRAASIVLTLWSVGSILAVPSAQAGDIALCKRNCDAQKCESKNRADICVNNYCAGIADPDCADRLRICQAAHNVYAKGQTTSGEVQQAIKAAEVAVAAAPAGPGPVAPPPPPPAPVGPPALGPVAYDPCGPGVPQPADKLAQGAILDLPGVGRKVFFFDPTAPENRTLAPAIGKKFGNTGLKYFELDANVRDKPTKAGHAIPGAGENPIKVVVQTAVAGGTVACVAPGVTIAALALPPEPCDGNAALLANHEIVKGGLITEPAIAAGEHFYYDPAVNPGIGVGNGTGRMGAHGEIMRVELSANVLLKTFADVPANYNPATFLAKNPVDVVVNTAAPGGAKVVCIDTAPSALVGALVIPPADPCDTNANGGVLLAGYKEGVGGIFNIPGGHPNPGHRVFIFDATEGANHDIQTLGTKIGASNYHWIEWETPAHIKHRDPGALGNLDIATLGRDEDRVKVVVKADRHNPKVACVVPGWPDLTLPQITAGVTAIPAFVAAPGGPGVGGPGGPGPVVGDRKVEDLIGPVEVLLAKASTARKIQNKLPGDKGFRNAFITKLFKDKTKVNTTAGDRELSPTEAQAVKDALDERMSDLVKSLKVMIKKFLQIPSKKAGKTNLDIVQARRFIGKLKDEEIAKNGESLPDNIEGWIQTLANIGALPAPGADKNVTIKGAISDYEVDRLKQILMYNTDE